MYIYIWELRPKLHTSPLWSNLAPVKSNMALIQWWEDIYLDTELIQCQAQVLTKSNFALWHGQNLRPSVPLYVLTQNHLGNLKLRFDFPVKTCARRAQVYTVYVLRTIQVLECYLRRKLWLLVKVCASTDVGASPVVYLDKSLISKHVSLIYI